MKIIKQIWNIPTGIVYVCIATYLAIAAPLALGFHPVIVLSGSMEPAYRVGSIIYYKQVSFEEIRVGDPITFHGEDANVRITHRVVEKYEAERTFKTEGDANGSPDPGMIAYANVEGKATPFCIPYAGYFVAAGRQPVAVAAMVLILLAGMAVDKMAKDEAMKEPKEAGQRPAERQQKPEEAGQKPVETWQKLEKSEQKPTETRQKPGKAEQE